jgi:hypothetical protein
VSAAFPAWAALTPRDRSAYLLKIADAIEANGDEFAMLESLNCGKPLAAARNDEIPAIADVYRFFAGAIRNMSGALAGEYLPGHTSMIRRDPLGVELPPHDGGLEVGSSHSHGQYRSAQTVGKHTADHAAHGRAAGRDPAAWRSKHRVWPG